MISPVRIALIHAVAVAMPPVEAAFERHWPEAERLNLLDDALSVDRSRNVETTSRISSLADYALGAGAAGILYTCSAFGDAIDAVKRRSKVPVLKPNEAMFDEARRRGKRIGLLATFAPSIPSMEAEFARARDAVAAAVSCPVLTSPDSAVRRLKAALSVPH